MISVVIPVYGQWQYTHQLLSDIRQKWEVDEIIVVDDCSLDNDTYLGCDFWKRSMGLKIKYMHNEDNLGFLLSANKGILSASGDIVVCMNNDVRVQSKTSWNHVKSTNDGVVYGGNLVLDGGWNVINGVVNPYLEGWFISATKKNWGSGFDERYAPSDFEDVDKCTEWIRSGIRLQPVYPQSVIHLGAKFYGYTSERQARTEKNRVTFAEKWSL